MKQKPRVAKPQDPEERELMEAIASPSYAFGRSALTKTRKKELQDAARTTLNDERVQITLRLSKRNLSKIKARALVEGMPYQTLINSILHKAVN